MVAGSADSGYLLEPGYFYQPTVKLPEDEILYTACLPQFAPLQFVVEAYAGVPDDVLVAGDLHNVFISDWPEFKASLDLPFARKDACPDALVIRPAERIFQAASSAQAEMFGGEKYVCVHWRRGDFKEWCAQLRDHACYFPPQQVGDESTASKACHGIACHCAENSDTSSSLSVVTSCRCLKLCEVGLKRFLPGSETSYTPLHVQEMECQSRFRMSLTAAHSFPVK